MRHDVPALDAAVGRATSGVMTALRRTVRRLRGERVRLALRVALSAGLLVALWRALDGEAAVQRLASAEAAWLAAAFAALNLQTLVSAVRWRLTAARFGQRLGLRRAVGEYYLALLVNQTLPGGVLGDAGRALRSRHQAGLVCAGQAVVLERFAGQLALFAVMIAGLTLTAAVPGGLAWPAGTAEAVGLGGLAVAAVGAALALATRLPGRLAEAARGSRRPLTGRSLPAPSGRGRPS